MSGCLGSLKSMISAMRSTFPEISLGNGCRGISGKTVEPFRPHSMYAWVALDMKCLQVQVPEGIRGFFGLYEVLTPSTFTCEPDPNQEGSGCVGVPAKSLGVQCKEGYHPSDATLSCSAGALTPASWSCLEDPCTPPTKIANAPELTCRQGNSIVSGTGCTTLCNEGYSPNHKSLFCHLGNFEPPTYVCEPDPCVVHEVANKLGSGCAGVPHPAMINSGVLRLAFFYASATGDLCTQNRASFQAACRTQCIEGYTPSVPEQSSGQEYFRALWGEGTTQCAEGYRPSVASLACSMGVLEANREASGCRGIRGKTVAAGTTCAPVCKTLNADRTPAAWSPSIGPLERAAEMAEVRHGAKTATPSELLRRHLFAVNLPLLPGFVKVECQPKPCKLPAVQPPGCDRCGELLLENRSSCRQLVVHESCIVSVLSKVCIEQVYFRFFEEEHYPMFMNRGGSGCTGVPGESIASGTVCQTQCIGGFTASVNQLTCTAEVLTPASFECTPNACPLPTVTNARGKWCRVQHDLRQGLQSICGDLEKLSPPGFICTEDDCDAVTGGRQDQRWENVHPALRGWIQSIPHLPGFLDGRPVAVEFSTRRPLHAKPTPVACDMPYVANSMNPTCAEARPALRRTCLGQKELDSSVFNANQICKAGYQPNKGTLECNDGVLQRACNPNPWVEYRTRSAPPPVGGNFFNCWTGDPHFVCRNQVGAGPLWTEVGRDSLGTCGGEVRSEFPGSPLLPSTGYGVTYRAQRSYWNRENNIRVEYAARMHWLQRQRLFTFNRVPERCVGAALKGEAVELQLDTDDDMWGEESSGR
ncbi:hypothetical protein AK812_SmicGene11322 [Symbiodinium microadriaticum]|uniref:Sushi domain-containing protein n=1 Tax=Symbiodinium microadriaticum TaxID=2951 RepID=A0A1Q9EDI4_SYMMI|nr:hypothetical protein AK812_SmicGene11322 [Symbiodinium microadriaticum]